MKKTPGPVVPLDPAAGKRRRLAKQCKPKPLGGEAPSSESAVERARREQTERASRAAEQIKIPKVHLLALRGKREFATYASRFTLAELGVTIPSTIPEKFRPLFEEGFRYGLASNVLKNLRMSFASGFRAAKLFARAIDPHHPLAAPLPGGYAKMRATCSF